MNAPYLTTPEQLFYDITMSQSLAEGLKDNKEMYGYYQGRVSAFEDVAARLYGEYWRKRVSKESKIKTLKLFGHDPKKCGIEE